MSGLIAEVEQWVEQHVAPDVAKVKDDIEKVLEFAEAHAANVQSLANIVLTAVKLIDPADAPAAAALIAAAEKAVAEADRIAQELLGKM